jgi:hypothetical protein
MFSGPNQFSPEVQRLSDGMSGRHEEGRVSHTLCDPEELFIELLGYLEFSANNMKCRQFIEHREEFRGFP